MLRYGTRNITSPRISLTIGVKRSTPGGHVRNNNKSNPKRKHVIHAESFNNTVRIDSFSPGLVPEPRGCLRRQRTNEVSQWFHGPGTEPPEVYILEKCFALTNPTRLYNGVEERYSTLRESRLHIFPPMRRAKKNFKRQKNKTKNEEEGSQPISGRMVEYTNKHTRIKHAMTEIETLRNPAAHSGPSITRIAHRLPSGRG